MTEVRAMLILAFTAPALAFSGPVLVKANKSCESQDGIVIFFFEILEFYFIILILS